MKCSTCGYRIRSERHYDGEHHQKGLRGARKPKGKYAHRHGK